MTNVSPDITVLRVCNALEARLPDDARVFDTGEYDSDAYATTYGPGTRAICVLAFGPDQIVVVAGHVFDDPPGRDDLEALMDREDAAGLLRSRENLLLSRETAGGRLTLERMRPRLVTTPR